MRSFRQLALLALPLLGGVACEEHTSLTSEDGTISKPSYANPNEGFQDLLNALPEESLREALHSLGPFRDGVFESDRHGVERVHHENPPLATKLIVAAVQDLKKRQVLFPRNGTAPTPPKSTVIPVETTRTNSRGQEEVSTESKPAVIFSTTDSAGRTIQTTSAIDFTTSYTPDTGPESSVVLITTTGSDGAQSVITSYTVVNPTATRTNGNSNPTDTDPGTPGLQTGVAVRNRAVDAVMMGGALGGALAFFV